MGLRSLAEVELRCALLDVGSDRLSIPPPCSRMLYKPLVGEEARQRLVVVDHFAGITCRDTMLLSTIREEALVVIENATTQWREEHLRTSLLGGYRIFSAGEFLRERSSSGVVLVVLPRRNTSGCDLLRRLKFDLLHRPLLSRLVV